MKNPAQNRLLYLTYDGLTDHIGESQILPYLLGCSQNGLQIHILSFEKIGNEEKVIQVQERLDAAGIKWHRLNFTIGRNVVFKAYDSLRFVFTAIRLAAKHKFAIVHSRSYMAGSVGYVVKKIFGSKLVFDKRDFWVDAQLETGRWKLSRFTDRIAYNFLRGMEKRLFLQADHIVSLTNMAKEIVLEKYPSRKPENITVIPCCADFNFYDPASLDPEKLEAIRQKARTEKSNFVLGYVGSLGVAYLQEEMMDFFNVLLQRKPNAKFLIVANNGHEFAKAAAVKKGIPESKIIITKAPREDVPYYIALFDLSVFFYYTRFSRKACSPTRLAELFAMNVPAITNSGVGDMDAMLLPHVNKSTVVKAFTTEEYENALSKVLSILGDSTPIRQNAGYFDLQRGVCLYRGVYKFLLSRQPLLQTSLSPEQQ